MIPSEGPPLLAQLTHKALHISFPRRANAATEMVGTKVPATSALQSYVSKPTFLPTLSIVIIARKDPANMTAGKLSVISSASMSTPEAFKMLTP